MKTCSPNQKGQGHTNGLSWNIIKMVLWIYMWGENTCLGVIEHYIWKWKLSNGFIQLGSTNIIK
jgi:hypothetical protein